MEKQKNKHNLLLFVPSAFLLLSLIGIVFFVIKNSSLKSDKNRLLLKNDSLISEKWKLNYKCDSLLAYLDTLKASHDSEMTHMYAEIEAKSKFFNYDNSQTYYYKKLYTDLKTENEKIQKQLDEILQECRELKSAKQLAENNFSELQKKYDALQLRTDSAKKVKCYDFTVSNFTKSKKNTFKSRKIKSSKITFKVAENLFAETGSKTAYVIVYNPQGRIIGLPQNVFTLSDNKSKINYTISKVFDYKGKDITLQGEIKYSEKLKKGNYKAEIYIDGICSGVSQFALK